VSTRLEILKAPAPILRQKCRTIYAGQFDVDLHNLAGDMLATAKDARGQGLAANQVGCDLRLIVVDVRGYPPMSMCNPVIDWAKGEEVAKEGCLSIPGIKVPVKRATKIRVSWRNLAGEAKSGVFVDLIARCIQHEVDHLDGVLILDYAAESERQLLESEP